MGIPVQKSLGSPLWTGRPLAGTGQNRQAKVLRFGVNTFSRWEEEAEAALKKAGINKDMLREQWGVTLWRILVFMDRINVFVDTTNAPDFDREAFIRLIEKPLSPFGRIALHQKPVSFCCHNQCPGCMASPRADRRNEWVV